MSTDNGVFFWPGSGSGGGGGVPVYVTFADFPNGTSAGQLAVAADTGILYEWNGSSWQVIGGPGSVLSIGTIDSQVASANGAVIASNSLVMQSATASVPGLVNNTTQTFSGVKTFNSAPNFFSLTASLPLQLDGSKNMIASAIDLSGSQATGVLAAARFPALTGDVTTVAGALATTIASGAVTLAKMANLAANSVIGNTSGSPATPSAVALGTVTETTSSILTLSSWTDATIGSPTITVQQSSGSQSGYLSSTDWTTFNNKSPAGNYATSGSGDVSWSAPSGPGAVTTSLIATSNSSLTTLSGLTTASALVTVGTIGTGVWQGTKVAIAYGGTNASSAIAGSIPQASSTTASSWTATPTLGVAATTAGTLALASATAATGLVTLANQGTTSGNAYTFSFPLTGGTSGYALTTNGSGTTTWSAVVTNPMTTLGDVIVGAASGVPARLAVGTDGFALTSNSNATDGVDWEDFSSSQQLRNLGFSTSVSTSILTVTLTQFDGSTAPTSTSPVRATFRSSTANSGAYVKRNIGATLTQTFTLGTSLGLGAQAQDLWLYIIDSDGAGTMKLGASAVLYNETDLQTTVAESGTATATNASPCVFTQNGHGYSINDCIQLTGTPPTGFSTSTPYYVVAAGLTANAFELAATPGGTAKNSSSTGSSIVAHYCGYKIASAAVYTSAPIRVIGKINETFATIGTWVAANSAALIQNIPHRQDISARFTASSTSVSGSAATITWTNIDNDPMNMSPGKSVVIIPATGHYNIIAAIQSAFTGTLDGALVTTILQNGSTKTQSENAVAVNVDVGNATAIDILSLSQNDLITVQFLNQNTTPTISGAAIGTYLSITKTGV